MSDQKQSLSPQFLAALADRLNRALVDSLCVHDTLPKANQGVNIGLNIDRDPGAPRIEVTVFSKANNKYGFTNCSMYLYSHSSKEKAKAFEQVVTKYLNDECTFEDLKDYS